MEELAHLLDVGGGAHERDRHVVHALLDAEAEVLAVLGRQARHRHRQPREGHALVVGDGAAGDHPAAHLAVLDRLHHQLDHAVIHPHRIARAQRGEKLGMVERAARGGAPDVPAGQGELLPAREQRLAAHEGAEAHLRPLEVLQDRDGAAPGALADGADDLRVLGVGAVGEVEPRHVHTRGHQAVEHLGRAGGRTDGADDLGLSHGRLALILGSAADCRLLLQGSSAAGAPTWPPHSPMRRATGSVMHRSSVCAPSTGR